MSAPYVWIKAVDKVYLDDPKFGGLSDAPGADNSATLQNAINACAFGYNNTRKQLLVLPGAAEIPIRQKVTVGACSGFGMEGGGMMSSRLIADPLTPGGDVFVINSSQHTRLEGFGFFGKKANPAGTMLKYDYAPVGLASWDHQLRDVLFESDDANLAYDNGIVFSSAYGNNSEVGLWNVIIRKWKEAAYWMTGSQQKAHCFYGCNFNGAWDAVAMGVNGGKYGVRCDNGNYSWHGGGIGACSIAAFTQGSSNAPIAIEKCQSEQCYRFFDGGEVATASRQSIEISRNRIATGLHDPSGVIKLNGVGPADIVGNELYSTVMPLPKIRISAAAGASGVYIARNHFLTFGSAAESPLLTPTISTDIARRSIILERNVYCTAAGQLTYRNEVLDREAVGQFDIRSDSHDVWFLSAGLFKANAQSQSVEWMADLPKGIQYEDFFIQTSNFFRHTDTSVNVTLRIGTTPGGDELLKDTLVSPPATDGAVFGKGDAYVGSRRSDAGGHMPDYHQKTKVYATLSLSSGVLGDGTTSNMTRGFCMCPVRYVVAGRYLA